MTTRQAKLNPVPYLLGLAMASNVGSAATLIGNPQNILISSLSGMRFAWYLALATPLAAVGLWFIYLLLCRLYRGELQGPLPQFQPLTGVMHKYLIKKGLVVVIVVLAGFLMGFDPAIVASLGAAYLLITRRIKPNKIYTGIDFNLLIIFIGLFVIIGGVENSGLFSLLIQLPWIERIQSLPVFALLTVTLSNIVSNVPAVMLLKHLIPLQAGHVWWAALAIFSTLAGNLTLTGSIANLIVAELAKKEKIDLGFSTYLKIGLPLTICLVLMALIYLTLLTRIFHLS